MGRNRRPLLRCVAWGTAVLLCMGMIGGAEVAVQKPEAAKKRVDEPVSANQKLLKVLDQSIETKTFEAPAGMSLKDFVGLLYDVLGKRGIEFPILVDFASFRDANPDVYKEPHDLLDETKITIPQVPTRLSLRQILEIAVTKIATNNATFIVRKGVIEIIPIELASPGALLNVPVAATFNNRRLAEAFQELSELTGATIVTSPRVATQLDNLITANMANRVPLRTAVRMLTDMADLKVVELPGALYITTPEHTEIMRKEHKAQEAEELWRNRHKLPLINPPPVERMKGADAGV